MKKLDVEYFQKQVSKLAIQHNCYIVSLNQPWSENIVPLIDKVYVMAQWYLIGCSRFLCWALSTSTFIQLKFVWIWEAHWNGGNLFPWKFHNFNPTISPRYHQCKGLKQCSTTFLGCRSMGLGKWKWGTCGETSQNLGKFMGEGGY